MILDHQQRIPQDHSNVGNGDEYRDGNPRRYCTRLLPCISHHTRTKQQNAQAFMRRNMVYFPTGIDRIDARIIANHHHYPKCE